MKEISITDIENIRIGQAEDTVGATGCTVVLAPQGAPAGVDVRGGAPASRETDLLAPLATVQAIHAVVLAGGSAFGLEAGCGVAEYLEKQGVGYDVGVARVPIVCQADLFDLKVGSSQARPTKQMGYEACLAAERSNYRDGNHGVGIGATIGKLIGMEHAMKSGIGSYAVQIGDLQLGAIVAVNSLGDVYEDGKIIAGCYDENGFCNTAELLYGIDSVMENKIAGNTTLAVVVTNAKLDKVQLTKIAGMAQNGYARTIKPVHTSADGDTVFAMSVGDVIADMDMVGTLAADVVAQAIIRAVRAAEPAYGFPAAVRK